MAHQQDMAPHRARTPRLQLLDAVAASDAPVTRHEIAGRSVVFVNEPELIREILVTRAASFEKSEFQHRVMGGAEGAATGLGDGMLTSANEANRRQRSRLRGLFSQPAVQGHVAGIAALAREQRDRWAAAAEVELGTSFMWLSTRIVARTLFSWDLGSDDEQVVAGLTLIGDVLGSTAKAREAGLAEPSQIEDAAGYLESRLLALVAQRRRVGPGERPDVIDALLDGPADRLVRDELMTLFITGAENPRNALTWAVYLLSKHPDAVQRIRDEVDRAGVADGHLDATVLANLPFTLRAFQEALRLYPPGYAFGRRATERVDVGPLVLEPGAEVVVSPYVMHRRPSLFPWPDEFRPDRFEHAPPPFAYLPFGVGPRECIGGGLSLAIGHVVLAIIFGSLSVRPFPGTVEPRPGMTLRPGVPVPVTVAPRDAS